MKLSDVFSVQPNKFSLDGKDMKLVTITFCPQAIQVSGGTVQCLPQSRVSRVSVPIGGGGGSDPFGKGTLGHL